MADANTNGARRVFDLAWPMTLKALMLHGAVVIDGYLVSSLGERALAAMGLAAAIAGFFLGAIFAVSAAMQIRTAQAYGTDDPVFLKSVLAAGLTLSGMIGGVAFVGLWLLGPGALHALAPSPDIADLAWSYLAVFSLVVLLEACGQVLASFFNGCGATRIPLISFGLSLPLNIALSVVLIHGLFGAPELGVVGAAIGSATAVAVQVAFMGAVLLRRYARLWRLAGWRQGTFGPTFRRHVSFTLPIAATFVSASFANQVCMLLYAKLSLNAFAALTLIMPWNMVAGQISMQWAQATGIVVAQMLGQRQSTDSLDRFLSSAWRGAFVTAAVVSLVFLVMCLSVEVIYPELEVATQQILFGFLPFLVITPFPRATNAICGNTLRSSGDTVYVMQIFLWSQWLFRVPATAIAVLVFQVPAIWILVIILVEEVIKFPAFHIRLWSGRWKQADVSE